MKNTLTDLNNHLFQQLERVNAEGIKPDKLRREIARSKAVAGLANQVVANGKLVLEAREAYKDSLPGARLPEMLTHEPPGPMGEESGTSDE